MRLSYDQIARNEHIDEELELSDNDHNFLLFFKINIEQNNRV